MAAARSQYAVLVMMLGRTGEALIEGRRAVELDPVSPTAHTNLAVLYSGAGEHDQALAHGEIAIGLAPNSVSEWLNQATHYSIAGRHREAVEWIERARAADPDLVLRADIEVYIRARAGERAGLPALLQRLQAEPNPDPYNLASLYAMLGEREQVLAQLDRAVARRHRDAPQISIDQAFLEYRGDPRFQALLKKIGLR
jgi:serine/threonine-protein kinase